jgi:DHA1 family tetracycline resistance protein-like MFS transporter
LGFAYAFTQFIFSPLVGNLSDKFGRPIILISLFGLRRLYFPGFGSHYLVAVFRKSYCRNYGASVTTAAYIADISTDEDRAKNFGLDRSCFGLGFIIGPVLEVFWGIMVQEFLFMQRRVMFLNFLYGYFILPESLDKDKRREFDWKRANPIGSFKF